MKEVFDAFYSVLIRVNAGPMAVDELVFVKSHSDVQRLKDAQEQYGFTVVSARVTHREDSDTILKLVEKIRQEAGG